MNSKHPLAAPIRVMIALFFVSAAASLPAAPELTGQVTDASGAALAGATVFVYTAGPKTGTSPFCPSCYPDCGKSAKSDAAGNFALAGLSSQLVFRLLVVAKGFAPRFVPGAEPGANRVEVALQPRKNADAPPGQTVRGRVVDPQGAPILGAVVDVSGVALDGGRQHFGGLQDIDPLAVTDENGDFILTSGTPIVGMLGRLSARAFANQSVQLTTDKMHTLTMTEGATLSGRVTLAGKPVPNVSVGVSPQDRRAGYDVGTFEVGTEADGRFSFTNLPPRTDYHLFGKMETVGRHGALPARPVHVGRDRETTDIGDLAVQPAFRVGGRVRLEDGGSLPDKSRLLIGRDQTSDVLLVELGVNGEFDVQGIPPGIVTLSARVPGYKVSAKNQSYEAGNRRLVGRVEADTAGLEMLLDKRDPNEGPIFAASLPRPKAGERPQDRALHGVEASAK